MTSDLPYVYGTVKATHAARTIPSAILVIAVATLAQHRLILGAAALPAAYFALPLLGAIVLGLLWARALTARDTARDCARRDPLTGVLNRTAFDEALDAELERANRYGHPFGVLMFDIDHFKQINDLDGHAVGDQILREAAALARSVVRSTDHLSRWGGDEFALIAPSTGMPGARVLAEKIRSTIAAHRFSVRGVVITVSVGMAQYVVGDDAESIMVRADEALYRAKRSGRNCSATMRCLRPTG